VCEDHEVDWGDVFCQVIVCRSISIFIQRLHIIEFQKYKSPCRQLHVIIHSEYTVTWSLQAGISICPLKIDWSSLPYRVTIVKSFIWSKDLDALVFKRSNLHHSQPCLISSWSHPDRCCLKRWINIIFSSTSRPASHRGVAVMNPASVRHSRIRVQLGDDRSRMVLTSHRMHPPARMGHAEFPQYSDDVLMQRGHCTSWARKYVEIFQMIEVQCIRIYICFKFGQDYLLLQYLC